MPQGGPLSSLLSNILLDDLIILVKSKRSGERVMESICRFLEKKLKVQVNRDKSKVVRTEKSTFLGFTFTGKRLTASENSSAYRMLISQSRGLRHSEHCGSGFTPLESDAFPVQLRSKK